MSVYSLLIGEIIVRINRDYKMQINIYLWMLYKPYPFLSIQYMMP